MRNDHYEAADDAIADTVWWLKGFCAGRAAADDEGDGAHRSLRDSMVKVRRWLQRLADGEVRRIGEERAVVLTFAEFETLIDMKHGNIRDVAAAMAMVERVHEKYRAEEKAYRASLDPNIPF